MPLRTNANDLVQPIGQIGRFKPFVLLSDGATDVVEAIRNYHVAVVFGWQDISQRYRRSKVGAFWITISVAVMIVALGLLFGTLFRAPLQEFLPFVAVGIILWTFIASMITEGCTTFIEASGMILQIRLPLFTHILRITWRNLIILGHNIVIIPIVLTAMQIFPEPVWLLAIPGFALLLINVTWMSLLLAVLCTRFRDITQAVQNLMQIAFFVTPIMWMPHTISDRLPQSILELNPFFHLISLVRSPLLGHSPDATSWLASLGLAILGWLSTLIFFGRFRRRIAYWL
jgi:lipopolysaccharide transport system permease protein